MPTKEEILKKVQTILMDQLGAEPDEVTTEADIIGDLGADSIDFVEILLALEEEFELEIPDEAAEKFRTVQNVVDYLAVRL